MSTVAEIKSAFEQLPEHEAWEVADWIQEVMEARWDRQITDDIASGRLDKLAEQAMSHYQAGRVKPLHEFLDNA
ncbi:MAG: hypothetical protein HZA90_03935 [Verrucomicrobia bacterium]|nr:hypothetical protein [Verrucomicrobiota bacterium]